MARIDLNMTAYEWYQQACIDPILKRRTINQFREGELPVKTSGRTLLLLQKHFMGTYMRDFCQMRKDDFSRYTGVGYKFIREISLALPYYGLSLAMTKAEIENYIDAYISECDEAVQDAGPEKINWEQRRWETAQMFLTRTFDLSYEEAITMADEFIEEYKKSLTKFTIL